MTIYSLDVLLSRFGTSQLFHVQLTAASWSAQFSQETGKVVWYSHLLKNFLPFVVIHTVKGFGVVNKADVFLELSFFFDDPTDAGNLISASSLFTKSSLNIWKFTVHVLLKTGFKNYEHYSASPWDEQLCGSLKILWHCLSLGLEWKLAFSSPVVTALFSKFVVIMSAALSQHPFLGFENSSTEIPSPPPALLVVMLPKAYLT